MLTFSPFRVIYVIEGGDFYDGIRESKSYNIEKTRRVVWRYFTAAWTESQHSQIVLQALQGEWFYTNNRPSLLQKLRSGNKADTAPKEKAVLLRQVPKRMVEQASRSS